MQLTWRWNPTGPISEPVAFLPKAFLFKATFQRDFSPSLKGCSLLGDPGLVQLSVTGFLGTFVYPAPMRLRSTGSPPFPREVFRLFWNLVGRVLGIGVDLALPFEMLLATIKILFRIPLLSGELLPWIARDKPT